MVFGDEVTSKDEGAVLDSSEIDWKNAIVESDGRQPIEVRISIPVGIEVVQNGIFKPKKVEGGILIARKFLESEVPQQLQDRKEIIAEFIMKKIEEVIKYADKRMKENEWRNQNV